MAEPDDDPQEATSKATAAEEAARQEAFRAAYEEETPQTATDPGRHTDSFRLAPR